MRTVIGVFFLYCTASNSKATSQQYCWMYSSQIICNSTFHSIRTNRSSNQIRNTSVLERSRHLKIFLQAWRWSFRRKGLGSFWIWKVFWFWTALCLKTVCVGAVKWHRRTLALQWLEGKMLWTKWIITYWIINTISPSLWASQWCLPAIPGQIPCFTRHSEVRG